MSLLAPLYALGILAVSLPVVFHLIRRMPRGELEFSSLMFLSPSPPRLAKRSRLEHVLLLLLRGLALALLAFAFARPFLRQDVPITPVDGEQKRVAIIVDISASMRRGDLWQQAAKNVDDTLATIGPLDQVAVYTCDDRLRPLVSFDDMSRITLDQRNAVVTERLKGVGPTWAGTELGAGLMEAIDELSNVAEARGGRAEVNRRIVLVSDMQEGARLNALADFSWPEDVQLELRPVRAMQATNAGLHRVAEKVAPASGPANEMRVRVSNDSRSTTDQFRLEWLNRENKSVGDAVGAYVPAGESRVVRVKVPPAADGEAGNEPSPGPSLKGRGGLRLHLIGDNCEFDNTLYLATEQGSARQVIFVGGDAADDPQGLRFYLERALENGLAQAVELVAAEDTRDLAIDSPTETPLVVIDSAPAPLAGELAKYVEAGGTVLYVMKDGAAGESEADVDGYTMLGQIDFSHPLFVAMAAPHFNDFTQIHFWKYRRLRPEQLGEDSRAIAKFENGDAVLVERRVGKGRVYALTSSWRPSDSQLARSWKFVLLMSALVNGDRLNELGRSYFTVNEPVPLEEFADQSGKIAVTKPDRSAIAVTGKSPRFDDTSTPGVYSYVLENQEHSFAVNIDPLESKTAPINAETLEQFGCRLVNERSLTSADAQQNLRDAQLEGRQKIWQWLVASALGVLVVETWLAGRASRTAQTVGVAA